MQRSSSRNWSVRAVARRLLVRRALILAYHRVTRLDSDPECLSVEPDRFKEHLDVLRRDFHVLALRDLQRRLDDGAVPKKAVVITFDDGYADNLLCAKPLLEQRDTPATCFVTSGKLDQRSEFWWDELARLLLEPAAVPDLLSVDVDGTRHSWSMRDDASARPAARDDSSGAWNVLKAAEASPRQKAYMELAAILRTRDAKTQDSVMQQLAAWAGTDRAVRETHRPMRPEEVARLHEGGLIDVGAHTVTHPVLSAHSQDAQRREIETAKQQLEGILNRRVSAFAYPFGARGDYSANTVEIVRTAGFACACSNFPGWVRRGTNAHELPRYLVRNWNGDEFARNLESWYAN
jgi:peptidoglycan/xylan/chitin deacetylase (PgdA/CDA1 family)